MNSSGIKRGLAVTAISALAITGIPALATPASAEPISASVTGPENGIVTASDVLLLNPDATPTPSEVTTSAYNLVAASNDDVPQVLFQFSPTGAAPWTNIGGVVDKVNGAFTQSWTPTGPGTVRVVPIDDSGTLFDGVAAGTTDQSVAQAVDVNLPALSATAKIAGPTNLGVWNSKATVGGANDYTVGVTGTTSLTDGPTAGDDDYAVALDQRTGGTGTGVADVAADGTFSGILNLDPAYAFPAGGPDQVVIGAEPRDLVGVVDGALANIEDAAAKTLYLAQLQTVTATADDASLQPGEQTDVVVTVTDSLGNPIAGADVYRSTPGGATALAGSTDADGTFTDTNVSGTLSGQYTYFVNAPADLVDNNQTVNEQALGDRSASVAVNIYTPVITEVEVDSFFGDAVDFDEFGSNGSFDDFLVTAVDQEGAPLAGQQLSYTWTVDPFDPTLPNQTSTPASSAGTTNADGETTFNFSAPGITGEPSGTWTLQVFKQAVGGSGAFSADPVVFKFGQAAVSFSPDDLQGAIGGSVTATGTLALEDDTALGSIIRPDTDETFTANGVANDVIRTAALAFTPGLEDNPATPVVEVGAGDSRLAPQLQQDSTVTNVNAGGTTGAVQFNAAGVANIKVNDATPETFEEIDANLNIDVTGAASSAGDNTDIEIDFLTTVVADDVASTVDVNAFAGPAAPGRPATVTYTVTNETGKALAGKTITVTVGGGGFITDNVTGALTTAQQNGTYVNNGTTATLTTDGDGEATVTVAIERNAGFDDDFEHTVTVQATSDAASTSDEIEFRSEDAVNLDRIEIIADEDNTAGDPDAQVDFETVEFDVFAYDQFGNLSDEDYSAEDDNPRAGINSAGDTQNLLDPPAIEAFADSATTQVIEVSATDLAGAAPSGTVTDESAPINWYEVDFAASSFTLGQQGPETVQAGTRVTEVLTVIDQEGRPVSGLDVEFLRSGPANEDSDGNDDDVTDADGNAFYDFVGGSAGTARISAVASINGTRVGTATDTVVFVGVIEEDEQVAIVAKTKGRNNGGKDDRITIRVSPQGVANGAVVRLFKVKGNQTGNRKTVVGTKRIRNNKAVFVINDRNGNKKTRYYSVVQATETSFRGRSNNRGLR